MKLHQNALIAVVDGSRLNLFENTASDGGVALKPLPPTQLEPHSGASGGRHHDSSANPSHGQGGEDDFAASVAAHLDKTVAASSSRQIVLVAAPKTLGELRKHLAKATVSAVVGELAKDLTGHSAKDVEKAIQAAT